MSLLFFSTNLAYAQNPSDNLELIEDSRCDGKIILRTVRYEGGNTIGDDLWIQFKNSTGSWVTIFHSNHYMAKGNMYTSDFYSGGEYLNSTSSDPYYWDYYFNPEAVDAAVYNSAVKIRAVESSDGTLDASDPTFEITCNPWKAKAPTNLQASTDFCDKVVINWDASANASGCSGNYTIYIDGSPTTNVTSPYTHTTTGSHKYKVAYVSASGFEGFISSETTGSTIGAGNPPSGVAATEDLCDGNIKITWQWYENNPTAGFDVLRNGVLLATVTGDKRDYTDVTATPGTTYLYDVGAKDVCGAAHYSTKATGFSIPNPAIAATPVAVADNVNNVINITWSNVGWAEQIILIRTSEDGTAEFELDPGTVSYTDDDAGGCTTYKYKIKTVNSCATKLSSVSAGVRIDPNLTNTFTTTKKLVCSKGYFNDKITLKWDYANINIVERFKIYRKEYGESGIGSVIATIDPTSTYTDESAEAGIYYVYTLRGEVNCESDILQNPDNGFNSDIGFRVPQAVVSGSVTYENGAGVEGVQIIAETEDDFGGNGLQFSASSNIQIPNNTSFNFSQGFSFQAWVKPTSGASSVLFSKSGQYSVTLSQDNISFLAGGQTLNLNFPQKVDTFFCVNAIRTADSLFVYAIYDELTVYKTSVLFSGSTPSNTNDIIYWNKSWKFVYRIFRRS